VYGTRISLLVGLAVAALSTLLGIAIGLPGDQIRALPLPGDDFPAVAPADAASVPAIVWLVEEARQQRTDLHAFERRQRQAHVLRLQAVYGEGIQNYFNDAPQDVGIVNNFSNTKTPILGKALPIVGLTGFLDLNWSEKVTSTIGYSRVDIRTTITQGDTAFKSGQYALTNLLFYPVKDFMLGPEFQWGYRDNRAGFHTPDYRIQFSARYNFSFRLGS